MINVQNIQGIPTNQQENDASSRRKTDKGYKLAVYRKTPKASKHLMRCSGSMVTREIQSKRTMRDYTYQSCKIEVARRYESGCGHSVTPTGSWWPCKLGVLPGRKRALFIPIRSMYTLWPSSFSPGTYPTENSHRGTRVLKIPIYNFLF